MWARMHRYGSLININPSAKTPVLLMRTVIFKTFCIMFWNIFRYLSSSLNIEEKSYFIGNGEEINRNYDTRLRVYQIWNVKNDIGTDK